MQTEAEELSRILSEQVSGFHRYCLEDPVRLTYASRNLLTMLGVSELSAEGYLSAVHPDDRARYGAFLSGLSCGSAENVLQYRMVKADGEVISVCDTVSTARAPDGSLMASSVLSNITGIQAENKNLQFLSDTVPCGFLRYSCQMQPRVTYLNDRMRSILRIPQDALAELYDGNVYTMIPAEERQRFRRYLERVSAGGVPLAGEMTVLRCDGTKAHLFGWVTVTRNESGENEYQSVCMDISERYRTQKAAELARYLSALHEVYDLIFEYDFSAGAVTCLYGQNSPTFCRFENIPMQMREATERWVRDSVYPADREQVLSFFRDFFQNRPTDGRPPQIRYQARASDGQWKSYLGLFLHISGTTSLYCCRRLTGQRESAALRLENSSLKSINENMQQLMQKLMMHFTDGIAAFEISGELVTPLYASDNVCSFFGFSRTEWLELMQKKTPITEFVRGSGIPYAEFEKALVHGEAEFSYPDLATGQIRRIKAICSQPTPGASQRYVMLYEMDEAAQPAAPAATIRTFGYFDVFVGGKPIAFRIQKAKELFALLVDRRGGYVTSDEAISYLWPEEPASPAVLARYRKVALRLKNILTEYGIPQVVEAVDGKRRIVTENVRCDLYDYLSGKPEHRALFKGSYMNNYSWGETTLGELTGENLY